MSLNLFIRKAIPGEIETLADIAFVAWERDLLPFLHGSATSREAGPSRPTSSPAPANSLASMAVLCTT